MARKSKLPLTFDPNAIARANENDRQLGLEEQVVRAILVRLGVTITPRIERKLSEVVDDRQVIGTSWLNTFMPIRVGTKKFFGSRTFPTAISQLWRLKEGKSTPEILALQDVVDEDSTYAAALITKYRDTQQLIVYSDEKWGRGTCLQVPGVIERDAGMETMFVQKFDVFFDEFFLSHRVDVPMEQL